MVEQSFSQKIRRENRWKWLTAVFATVICVALVYAHLAISVNQGMLENRSFLHIFFVQGLILVLSSGIAWSMRDAQRHDLYVEVRRHSLTQLKRFRSEIDDEIERLEQETEQSDIQNGKVTSISKGR